MKMISMIELSRLFGKSIEAVHAKDTAEQWGEYCAERDKLINAVTGEIDKVSIGDKVLYADGDVGGQSLDKIVDIGDGWIKVWERSGKIDMDNIVCVVRR